MKVVEYGVFSQKDFRSTLVCHIFSLKGERWRPLGIISVTTTCNWGYFSRNLTTEDIMMAAISSDLSVIMLLVPTRITTVVTVGGRERLSTLHKTFSALSPPRPKFTKLCAERSFQTSGYLDNDRTRLSPITTIDACDLIPLFIWRWWHAYQPSMSRG